MGILALAVIAVGYVALHSPKSGGSLGDSTVSNYPTWYYNGIVIGPQNTLLSQMTFGTCNLTGTGSVTALGITTGSCIATGTKVGDKVFMTQPTLGGTGSYPIVAASVTTNGLITAKLQNLTGGAAAPTTGAITAVQYMVVR